MTVYFVVVWDTNEEIQEEGKENEKSLIDYRFAKN